LLFLLLLEDFAAYNI